MLKLLKNLFVRGNREVRPDAEQTLTPALQPEYAAPERARFPLGNGICWTYDEVPNGMGGYKTVDVHLLKADDPAYRRCIVNRAGEIQGFPGFRDEKWQEDMEFPIDQTVRFVFWISPYREDRARVRWVLQPDGRYFADEDGFGAEDCEEIEMYSWLDEEGRFTEPFERR